MAALHTAVIRLPLRSNLLCILEQWWRWYDSYLFAPFGKAFLHYARMRLPGFSTERIVLNFQSEGRHQIKQLINPTPTALRPAGGAALRLPHRTLHQTQSADRTSSRRAARLAHSAAPIAHTREDR